MSSNSFDLIAVKSHTEAVARLAEDTIDVILLALALPEATGLRSSPGCAPLFLTFRLLW